MSRIFELNLDEQMLRRNAEIAARIGVELFVVDLGWARQIGDWHSDRQKLPNGLRSLSDYVHSLGMKFGLHFALGEAAPDSPVLRVAKSGSMAPGSYSPARPATFSFQWTSWETSCLTCTPRTMSSGLRPTRCFCSPRRLQQPFQ